MSQQKHWQIIGILKGAIFAYFLLFSLKGFAQTAGTQATLTVQNFQQLNLSSFQYDVFVTNTGTTSLALRGYSWGLNATTGIINGGVMTHSFVSRDASISLTTFPQVTASFTTSLNHLRAQTVNATSGNEIYLPFGIPLRVATMLVNNTVPFPTNFNPFLSPTGAPIQITAAGGRLNTAITCRVNYIQGSAGSGDNYAFVSPLNASTSSTLNVLNCVMNPSPTGTSPFMLNGYGPCGNANHISATACDAYTWGAPSGNGSTYINSGTYTYTFPQVGNPTCIDTNYLHLTINLSSTFTTVATACTSYTWLVNNLTYTNTGIYTYTGININGCASLQTLNLAIGCPSILNVKFYLEGYYAGSGLMTSVLQNQGVGTSIMNTDSVIVELHDPTTFATIASVKSIVQIGGTSNCVFPQLSGSYYIVIKHRSSLETWSATPIPIGETTAYYDFTPSNHHAFGSNQVEVAADVWAFKTGDINQDENIDLLDLIEVEEHINLSNAYHAADLNGDGHIDLLDMAILPNNINSFSYVVHP